MGRRRIAIALFVALLACPPPVSAQQAPAASGSFRVEGQVGTINFAETDKFDHLVLSGAARFRLTQRLAIGPDVTYMRGPGRDRDELVFGVLAVDLGPTPAHPVQPYLLAGFGYGRHRDEFISNTGGIIDAGFGMRIALSRRWYISPEVRAGWARHIRFGASLGWQAP